VILLSGGHCAPQSLATALLLLLFIFHQKYDKNITKIHNKVSYKRKKSIKTFTFALKITQT